VDEEEESEDMDVREELAVGSGREDET